MNAVVDMSNIPQEVLQQFYIEQAPQTLGDTPAALAAIAEPPVPVPGSSTVSNTSVTNATAQNVANRATLQTTTFTGSYQGLNNPNRSYLLIQNTGGSTMYVVYGGTQQGTNGLQIPPTGYVETLVGPTNNFSITGDGVLVEGIGP